MAHSLMVHSLADLILADMGFFIFLGVFVYFVPRFTLIGVGWILFFHYFGYYGRFKSLLPNWYWVATYIPFATLVIVAILLELGIIPDLKALLKRRKSRREKS